jgi:anaphase-promoting complex subunit 8
MSLDCFLRASELHLSIPISKRNAAQSTSPPTSKFSTSTPARVRSPPPSAPFEQSPVPTQPLTQISIPITPARHPHAPSLQAQPEDVRAMETDLEYQEADNLVTARACFEAREFLRAKFLLENCRSSKARFLSVYSQFIVS